MARFVLFSHTPADSVFRVGSHHYARELARAGHQVLRVSIPTSPMRRLVRDRDSLRQVRLVKARTWTEESGAAHLEMDLPAPLGRGPRLVHGLTDALGARIVVDHLPTVPQGHSTYYVVDDPRFVGLVRRLPSATTIYRPTDAQDHARTRQAESAMVGLADAVIATSDYLREQLPPALRTLPAIILPNGVDLRHLLSAPASPSRRGVVYVGSLDQRFSWHTVALLADSVPELSFDIYGPPVGIVPSLPPNCLLRGPLPYERLPEVLRAAQVGILPLSSSDLNASRSPMKLFEYLAAGLAVVAQQAPAYEQLDLPNTYLYASEGGAVNALRSALDSTIDARGIEVAREHSWTSKAAALAAFANDVEGGERCSSAG